MQVTIQCSGMDTTNSIKQYAKEKIASLDKFFDNIQSADIDVGMHSTHHQKGKVYYAVVNLNVPGKVVRCEKEAEDLYKAIDKVKDHLKVELQKMKEKMRAVNKKILRDNKEYRG
jgi:ribosomal subunit interface protein